MAHVLRISRVPQMRDRRLQRIEAVIERQQRVPAKGKNDRLFPIDSTVEVGCLGPVGRSATELRFFGHGLRVDAVALGQSPQALLTTLYRSTDRLCCGAAAGENGAPSKLGIKYLERWRRPLSL